MDWKKRFPDEIPPHTRDFSRELGGYSYKKSCYTSEQLNKKIIIST